MASNQTSSNWLWSILPKFGFSCNSKEDEFLGGSVDLTFQGMEKHQLQPTLNGARVVMYGFPVELVSNPAGTGVFVETDLKKPGLAVFEMSNGKRYSACVFGVPGRLKVQIEETKLQVLFHWVQIQDVLVELKKSFVYDVEQSNCQHLVRLLADACRSPPHDQAAVCVATDVRQL